MKIIKEFREFAIKGNMFDMAIGIIIGAAFNKIVSSFVSDIIMPPLGLLIGNVNFSNLQFILQPQILDAEGNVTQEMIAINYGSFIMVLIDFLIIALTVFMVIRMFNKLKKKADNPQDTTVPTPKDIQLLTEIRDLLKK